MALVLKVAQLCLCAIPALLLAAGITGETGKLEYGALVMVAFVCGRLSK